MSKAIQTEQHNDQHAGALPVVIGLIDESDFNRLELFGFEVDMDGRVLVPELAPNPVSVTGGKAA